MNDLDAWVHQLDAEQMSQARGSADTAKLVATFAAAIAATLVGTQLQVRSGSMTRWDGAAIVAFAACVVLALAVAYLDRLVTVDALDVIQSQGVHQETPEALVAALRGALHQASKINEGVVHQIKVAVLMQVTAAGIASALAIGLTWGGRSG